MKKMTVVIALLLVVAQAAGRVRNTDPGSDAGPGDSADRSAGSTDGGSRSADGGPGCGWKIYHRHFQSVHQQRVSHADDSGIEGRECRVHGGGPDE